MHAPATRLLSSLLLIAAACDGRSVPPDPGSAARVAVEPAAGGVRLRNDTEQPIAYTMFERGFPAQFSPCLDPSPGCVRLAPGASTLVPHAEIGGYHPGATKAIVYWWHVVNDGAGGYGADEIRFVVVSL